MMRWSSPDIYNMAHNCTRHMMLAGMTHYEAMVDIMDYCVTTPERGLVLKPHNDLDGISTDYEFEVTVKMDFNDHDRKCGVPEWSAGNIE